MYSAYINALFLFLFLTCFLFLFVCFFFLMLLEIQQGQNWEVNKLVVAFVSQKRIKFLEIPKWRRGPTIWDGGSCIMLNQNLQLRLDGNSYSDIHPAGIFFGLFFSSSNLLLKKNVRTVVADRFSWAILNFKDRL